MSPRTQLYHMSGGGDFSDIASIIIKIQKLQGSENVGASKIVLNVITILLAPNPHNHCAEATSTSTFQLINKLFRAEPFKPPFLITCLTPRHVSALLCYLQGVYWLLWILKLTWLNTSPQDGVDLLKHVKLTIWWLCFSQRVHFIVKWSYNISFIFYVKSLSVMVVKIPTVSPHI